MQSGQLYRLQLHKIFRHINSLYLNLKLHLMMSNSAQCQKKKKKKTNKGQKEKESAASDLIKVFLLRSSLIWTYMYAVYTKIILRKF